MMKRDAMTLPGVERQESYCPMSEEKGIHYTTHSPECYPRSDVRVSAGIEAEGSYSGLSRHCGRSTIECLSYLGP